MSTPTYFHRESRRKLHVDEVLQLLEVGVGDGEQVDDGHDLHQYHHHRHHHYHHHYLLLQRQRVVLTQPELGAELLTLLTLLPRPETAPNQKSVW